MQKSKIIIVEGPQGVGKTTITDFIRNTVSYTNLYRLSGTNDVSPTGKQKSTILFEALMDYIEKIKDMEMNLVFDRTFFTEEVYCRLGFKEYSFTDEYNKLIKSLANTDYDIYYFTLFLKNVEEYKIRLDRPGKAKYKNVPFNIENSIKQQNEYLKLADEIKEQYPNINVFKIDTSRELKQIEEEIIGIIGKK